MKLTKFPGNPILSGNDENDWESLCVLNPAVIYDEALKRFVMLYRAAGNDAEHRIHLGLADSEDGFHFRRASSKPVFSPDESNPDGGCVEDPRLVELSGVYYMTYAARAFAPGQYWSGDWRPLGERPVEGPEFLKKNNSVTYLASTKDFHSFRRLGRISDSRLDDRDVLIFPGRVGGEYVRLSRPMEWCGEGFPNAAPAIWISKSADLLEWGTPQLLMQGEAWWEDKKIGASCPPILTEYGWLHLYHGVSSRDDAYRVGAVLLDESDPSVILARTPEPILEPEFEYETSGFYNGCVFPTGNVVRNGILYVYYGAADRYICAASVQLSELLNYLVKECRRS